MKPLKPLTPFLLLLSLLFTIFFFAKHENFTLPRPELSFADTVTSTPFTNNDPLPSCGNGKVDPGEACDGSDTNASEGVNNYTCSTVAAGFVSGTLTCNSDCKSYNTTQCVTGHTIVATSCEQPAVQTAIDSASDGDIVVVPAGNCTWNSGVTINKGILLKGLGIGNTILTAGAGGFYFITYEPLNYSANKPFRVTGLTMDFGDESSGISLGVGGRDAPFTIQTGIRIDHIHFLNAPTQSHNAIFSHARMFGVVDNCNFENIAYPARSDAGIGNSSFWDNFTFTFGANDNLYYEDNNFSGVSSGVVEDCQYSGRYAYRYNTIVMPVNASPLFDMHGNHYSSNPGASMWSCFGGEIYGNLVQSGSNKVDLLDQRGGKTLVFGNNIVTTGNTSMQVREEWTDSDNPTTSLEPQHIHDTYYWNNRKNTTTPILGALFVPLSGSATGGGDNYLDDSTQNFSGSFSNSFPTTYGLNIYDGTGAGQTEQISSVTDTRVTVNNNWSTDPDNTSKYKIISDCCKVLSENSQFYNQKPSFDGTTGIGCGHQADMPPTCTTGVGYWATDQNCAGVDDANVGANPTTPIKGTLYKCTAPDTWTAYYTPYVYPHPLSLIDPQPSYCGDGVVNQDTVAPTIVDNTNIPSGDISTGWTPSTYFSTTMYSTNYLHDGNTGKGTKTVKFNPNLTAAGSYKVSIWYPQGDSTYPGATQVPIVIKHSGTTTPVTFNESTNGGQWNQIGTYDFNGLGDEYSLVQTTSATDGYVFADAFKFEPATQIQEQCDHGTAHNGTPGDTCSATCMNVVSYTLSTPATNGTVTKSPDQATYDSGTSVTITANPSTGYTFLNWTGDATGTTNPITVTMNGNKTITANFTAKKVELISVSNSVLNTYTTVQACANAVTSGQTCLIYAGTYDETVTVTHSGTAGNPITFTGSGDVYVKQIFIGSSDNHTNCASYVILNNLIIGSASNSSYSILYANRCSDHLIINGSTIDGHNITDLEGISLFGDHDLMTGSTVQNIDDTYAVSVGEADRRDGLGTDSVTVTHSIIKDCKDTDAFRVHGTNHIISFNEVKNMDKDANVDRNHGDFVQWFTNDNACATSYDVRNILIEGNYVHDAKVQVWYGNNICQPQGTVVDNIVFRNNIFYRVGLMSQDNGQAFSNLKIYNNVFDTVGYMYYLFGTTRTFSSNAISFGSHSTGVEVKNNVFLNCGDEPTHTDKGCYATNNASGLTASNNYCGGPSYTTKSTAYFTEGSPSINGGDPKFVNVLSQDYHLQSISPLKDVGLNLSVSFTKDKDGITRNVPWDIGAYEYTTTPPPGPPTCTSFTYTAWSPAVCPVSGTQTHTVVTSSPSGCTGGTPVLSQSCTYVPPYIGGGGGGGTPPPPVCSAITYSPWSPCTATSTLQTRLVLTKTPTNCSTVATTTQACTLATSTSPLITATSTPGASTPLFLFTHILNPYTTDPDVKYLQIFLNTHGFIIAKTGTSSPSHETAYFNDATRLALIRFQNAHYTNILKPAGVTKGTGVFGLGSIKYVNSILKQEASTAPAPSVCQFIDLLITIDVIPQSKVGAAKGALGCR